MSARGRLAVAFPWLVLAITIGVIVWDQTRTRETIVLDASPVAAPDGAATAAAAVAVDPVCGMDVRRSASYRVVHEGVELAFCSTYCRDELVASPEKFVGASAAAAPVAADGGHTMRGIPAWLYQLSLALIIVLSFGTFELLSWLGSRRDGAAATETPATAARVDLLGRGVLYRLVRSPLPRFAAQVVSASLFILVIVAGLFGHQNPAMNIAPLLTWTIWWAGLIFVILYAGKAFCTVCPWDAIATWIERLRPWGPRGEGGGLSLGLRWPRRLRNIWPAVILFVLLTWVELGLGITMIPRATAWLALGMLGMAVGSILLFDRKAFCRYGCLVGQVSGLYAQFSSIELRVTDPTACATCTTMDCYKGNERGEGCPTFEFPKTMNRSTYCTLCTECIRTCPHESISIRARPWAADLVADPVAASGPKAKTGAVGPLRPVRSVLPTGRSDEATLAVVLLSMTSFHGLTMTPSWPRWNEAIADFAGVAISISFAAVMLVAIIVPIALFWALSAASAALLGEVGGVRGVFFRYAAALLPIALFYHLAHNAEHLLVEGPKVLALASDPFGWGWNLFGTAGWSVPPLITLEGLWVIQVLFVVIGHVYGLWISERITRALVPDDRRRAFVGQLPMLAAMVVFSVVSLWLLYQPMEMRISAM